MTKILTIDPGLGGTGLALFREESWVETKVLKPEDSKASWERRADSIAEQFIKWISQKGYFPNRAFIEFVSVQQSKRGVAALRKGDLFKLSFLVGRLYEIIYDMSKEPGYDAIDISLIFPSDWKGSMCKKQVDARIMKILGCEFEDHASDAVGMGLWLQGRF